jgi:hypothetical protein
MKLAEQQALEGMTVDACRNFHAGMLKFYLNVFDFAYTITICQIAAVYFRVMESILPSSNKATHDNLTYCGRKNLF